MKIIKATIAFGLSLGLSFTTPAIADVNLYRLLGGSDAVQDFHQKISQIEASIRASLQTLIGDVDERVEQRLSQIDAIVDDALAEISALPEEAEESALRVLAEAERSLLELEGQVFRDVQETIFQVECAATIFTLDTLQSGLGGLGNVLGTGQIEINPPLGVDSTFWQRLTGSDRGTVTFDISNNFESTALEIRTYLLEALSGMQDDDRAYAIPETYNYLALLARRTTCFSGTQEYSPWVRDHVNFTNASGDWYQYANPSRG